MKEIDDVKYYNIAEIYDMFEGKYNHEILNEYFEQGKIKGRKIEGKWYADNKAIKDFMNSIVKESVFFITPQENDLTDIELKGRILDIGGGGEGIIGRLKGKQVIAIDLHDYELEGAPEGDYLKIIMDAKEMKFLKETFDTVTSFFTLMYAPTIDHKQIFQEVYRVLKKDGEFVIWDIVIPNRGSNEKDMFGFYLEVKMGDKKVSTGYGTAWDKEQNMDYFSTLGKSEGFEVIDHYKKPDMFFIRFKKI